MAETRDEETRLHDLDLQQGVGLQTGSDTMFENIGIPTKDEHLQ
jgi:hypothetical protein